MLGAFLKIYQFEIPPALGYEEDLSEESEVGSTARQTTWVGEASNQWTLFVDVRCSVLAVPSLVFATMRLFIGFFLPWFMFAPCAVILNVVDEALSDGRSLRRGWFRWGSSAACDNL